MPIANIRGVNINYEIIGDRGPWVAMITGGRRAYNEFVPLSRKIAKAGFRVLLHDRRNTGASDMRDGFRRGRGSDLGRRPRSAC